MFSNATVNNEANLSDIINTNRLHNEALNRYTNMFGESSTSQDTLSKPSLIEARFECLTQIMQQERKEGNDVLSRVFSSRS